ncbi:glycoside hydrolase family 25 [Limosilactobacillus sp. STM2_1]|uniref:Glycoside hydrolase family 25 n=1 Tax=Limosilactobacillus rudii TaxID=2759755 RepID=A0A7W3YNN6_9LACO|nr:GH25 family lysozyme [Limosilactobacillus rudii]MBB1078797.1 glycoside hydrolase family 25 [Limosilactobacillus rudii]MBB1097651.1 glycoside hydrolase family 25 [Limosilactobacillus rudii]MCD7134760.1 glycoside hydrolase family 25 [Limosilactobacillus rudii]
MPLYFTDVFSGSADWIVTDPHAQGTIVKVSQGTGYLNPKYEYQYSLAKNSGRLLGLYHYAGGNNPVAEANYFLSHIQDKLGEAVLAVDWEQYQNAAWGDTSWVRRFVDTVHQQTGVWPLIYVQESAIWQVANCVNDCGLWVAKYASMNWHSWQVPTITVNTSPWQAYTLWQFAGDDEDRSIATVDRQGWKQLANPTGKISAGVTNDNLLTWTDSLGDVWHREKGRFITDRVLDLRWGALPTSAVIATLPLGSVIDYDAWSRHNGYVWLRQPRANGEYGYLPCRNAETNEPFGKFEPLA